MEFLVLLLVIGLPLGGWWLIHRFIGRKHRGQPNTAQRTDGRPGPQRWNGVIECPLPLKQVTVAQADCLHDASCGARIVAVRSSEILNPQDDDTTMAHPTRTVASLVKHGLLKHDGTGLYVVTELGLRVRETCSVKY